MSGCSRQGQITETLLRDYDALVQDGAGRGRSCASAGSFHAGQLMSPPPPPPPQSPPSDTTIDYGLAAEDYGAYRQGFPPEFFARVAALGVGKRGQRLLDLGTGTGLLAREFAQRGCQVTGIDFSARLLAIANRANAGEVVRPKYLRGRAERTGLARGIVRRRCRRYQLASVRQGGGCPKEARRLLAAWRTCLLIAHLDWHTASGNIAEATSRLMERYQAHRSARHDMTFQYPEWADGTDAGWFS